MNDVSVVIVVPAENGAENTAEAEPTAVRKAVEDIENIDSSDELVEQLLRRAEENLASKDSPDEETVKPRIMYDPFPFCSHNSLDPGPLPKPYLEITKKGINKLLTDQLEDSVIITSHNGTVKRLSPPLSKKEKEKVCPRPSYAPFSNDVILFAFLRSNVQDCRFGILLH